MPERGGVFVNALLRRRLLAEFLGSAFLTAVVIGSGIARAAALAGRRRPGVVRERGRDRGRAVHDHPHVRPGLGRALQPGRVARRRELRRAPLAARVRLRPGAGRRLHRRRDRRERDVRDRRGEHLDQAPRVAAHLFAEVIATLGLLLVIFSLARTKTRGVRARRGRRLHRRGVLLHQLDQLRQPRDRHRPHVLQHLRRDRPAPSPATWSPSSSAASSRSCVSGRCTPTSRPRRRATVVAPAPGRTPTRAARPQRRPIVPDVRQMTHIVAIGGSDAGISAALRARELDPTRVHGRGRRRLPELLDLRHPLLRLRRGHPLAQPRPPHHRRPRSDRHAAAPRHASPAASTPTRTASCIAGRRRQRGHGSTTTRWSSAPARSRSAADRRARPRSAPSDGVHLLHSMGDTFALMRTLEQHAVERAVIVGAGYIGLEMAEGLTARGLKVTQLEQLPEVLPTVDPELGALVHAELERHGVTVCCNTRVQAIASATRRLAARLEVEATGPDGEPLDFPPTSSSSSSACGPTPSSPPTRAPSSVQGRDRRRPPDAHQPSRRLRRRRLRRHPPPPARPTYLPLGTTAHKQGRVAGENALGGSREFAGSLGTQVVKVFDLVAARTGLRDHEATAAGYDPVSVTTHADDHKAYYPGSHPITMRYTGDRDTGRLLGVQLVGHLRQPRSPNASTCRHGHLQRDDRRRDLRPRPLLHAAARLALGSAPGRRPDMDATRSGCPMGDPSTWSLSPFAENFAAFQKRQPALQGLAGACATRLPVRATRQPAHEPLAWRMYLRSRSPSLSRSSILPSSRLAAISPIVCNPLLGNLRGRGHRSDLREKLLLSIQRRPLLPILDGVRLGARMVDDRDADDD